MAIEIVDFPVKHGGSLHSYVTNYQRVKPLGCNSDVNTMGFSQKNPENFTEKCFLGFHWVHINRD